MLADRTPEAATRRLIQDLGAVTRWVTHAHPTVAFSHADAGPFRVAELATPGVLRSASGGPSGLLLDLLYGFELVERAQAPLRQRWAVEARVYAYRLLDQHHRELLVYHWHPGQRFEGPDHPHLHVSASLDAQVDAITRREIGLDKLHLATGIVTLADVVRMLIEEFGIAPHRHDWRDVLDRADDAPRDA